MRRARVFPLFRRFRGGRKKTVSIERTRAPAAFSRLVLSGSARECQVGMPNPQSGVNFFLSCPTLGGETETPHETREKTKRARRIFRFCQLVPQARTIFRETSNDRAREWHYRDARTEGSGPRNAPHAGSRRSAEEAPARRCAFRSRPLERRARRVATDAFQKMLVFSPFAPSRVSRQPPSGDAPGRRARRRLRDAERRARL